MQVVRPDKPMSLEELKAFLLTPPSEEELARRRAVFARIVEGRKRRVITPLTTSDLIHIARQEEYDSYYDPDR